MSFLLPRLIKLNLTVDIYEKLILLHDLWVVRCQFHQHFTCAIFVQKLTKGVDFTNILRKCAHKMLLKLIKGVDFTNILKTVFRTKVVAVVVLLLHFRFVYFWRKKIGIKASRKMLVKLTKGRIRQST
jgi:hypothetical protein